ncbi:MAG: PDZ domain-containing protein [Planctomycetota bacterium]
MIGSPTSRVAFFTNFAVVLVMSCWVAISAAASEPIEVLVADQPVTWGTPIEAPAWIQSNAQPATFVLTKNSEIRIDASASDSPVKLAVRDAAGVTYSAEAVAFDRASDLKLLCVPGLVLPEDAAPLRLNVSTDTTPSPPTSPPGTFVVVPSASRDQPPLRGIVSGPPRVIPSQAKMGVFFAEGVARPIVRAVQAGSGADAAGLRRGDVLLQVDGRNTPTPLAVIDAVQAEPRYPGDTLDVTLQRPSANPDRPAQRLTLTLELGRVPPKPTSREQRLERSPYNAAPPSLRASGFPFALPIDAPVPASQCGGPAFDNHGRLLGIVIARVGRTETLLLPPEQIVDALARMRPD